MTHPGDPRTASQAALNYQKAVDLEKHLLTSLQSKGPFDPNVRILRDNIRELYESIILDDHEFAESHDVEQHIWRLHHTRIDDFRARIRKSMASANSVSATATGVPSGNKSGGRRDPVHKILAVFRSFLAEATGFYHDLILKIKAKHGLSQDDLYLEENTHSKHDDKKVTELKRCQLSCHRCLIYLGDLARYKEYYGDGDATNRDWSIAAGFYVKAGSLWPASGNPHNQLAVLATYVGDELLAVYHYFRSLAAETPFLTAKDNLIVLFEKNRHSYMRLVASFEKEKSAHDSGSQGQLNTGISKGKSKVSRKSPSRAGDTKQKQSDQHYSELTAVASNASEIVKSFRIRFVRLNGILFTRTSLETFAHVHSSILSELKQLLTSKPKGGDLEVSCNVLATGGMWGTGPNIVLQLVAILIFTVHNVNWGSDSHQPTYAEILQRSVILEHAFIATFECAGCIMQHCVDAGNASSSPFLPAVLVIMEWLACRPEMALGTEIKEKEGNARVFFWKACVKLLNKLLDDDVRHDAKGSLKHSKEGNDIGSILWEDQELQGFTPLQPVQANLNFFKRPNVGVENEKDNCTRVQRIIRAGKCVSLSFEGSENGIYYDEETGRFYCSGDKVKRDKMRDGDFVSTNECLVSKDLETPNEVIGFVSLNEKQVDSYLSRDVELSSLKLTSGEEEDEVIVFRPSAKLNQVNSDGNVADAVSVRKESVDEICNSASLGNAQFSSWNQTKASESFGDNWNPSAPANILHGPLPSSVPSPLAILAPHVTRINALPLEPVVSTVSATGSITEGGCRNSLVDGDGMYMESRSRDNSLSVGFPLASNVFESSYKAPNGASVTPLNAWGAGKEFGMFQSQHPWTPLPGNATYGTAGRSLWNPELHMLAAAKMFTGVGPNSSSSMSGGRIALADVFPNLKQTSESPLSSSEISNLLPTSVVNDLQATAPFASDIKNTLLDNIIKYQEANVMHKEDKPLNAQMGGYGQRESRLPASAALKTAAGPSSDTEKTVPRTAGRPSGMRPPPGFGPLPGKLSTTVPMTSTAPGSQSVGGQLVGTSVQPKVVPDSLPSLTGYEHVDDYGWLDGYTAPEREIRQVTNFGKVKSAGPSEYEMWTGGNNAANQGTLSPFPGMKVFDSFVNSPSVLQQQHQIAHLQQELFKNQQLHLEQERHQILQEHRRQQVQQLYNAQLIAQRDQLHAEQQLSSQEPLSLQQQQQQPHPPWHGANSFVS